MKNILPGLLLCFSINAYSQTPTWNGEVASIVFTHCTSCHNETGVGHFPLTSYAAAKDVDDEILDAIEENKMPPWPPDENYVHFTNERVLSETERNTIMDWVAGGAPMGSGDEPVPPVYVSGPQMEDIDKEVALPEYTISQNTDEYRTFVLHSDLTETKYIRGIEFLPGNGTAVHHILIYQDTSGQSWLNDQADPQPGYATNGASLPSASAKLISGWAPGQNIGYLPLGMGFELPAGSDIVVEVHYAPEHIYETDQTTLNFNYSDAPFTRPVWVDPILYHYYPCFQEPLFYIPANTVQTFHEIFDEDIALNLTLVSVSPHMHLLGKTFWAYGLTEAGDSIPLIKIDDWDFHWQAAYQFQKLLKIPAHTHFYGEASYDNTTANENNPNDPPQDVWLGKQTTDEMMLCFFAYTFYLPGDENIVLDSSVLTAVETPLLQGVNVFPNPVADQITIQAFNIGAPQYTLKAYDLFGREVYTEVVQGTSQHELVIAQWPEGMYTIVITAQGKQRTFKVMKIKDV